MLIIKDLYAVCTKREMLDLLEELVQFARENELGNTKDSDLYLRMKCKQLANVFAEFKNSESIEYDKLVAPASNL